MAQLNSKIFTPSGEMRPEVRERLLEIADEFISGLEEKVPFKVYDIRLVGSNAAYNYTKNSDIDLHLVVDLAEICKSNPEIVQYLFDSEKSRFNMNYDISVKGADVEIYVEDIKAGTISNGIYSVLKDEWIKFPEDNSEQWSDFDPDLSDIYLDWLHRLTEVLEDDSANSEEISDLIDDFYMLRKNSLETDGEYGEGNLVFKTLRNKGFLDDLRSKYHEIRSNELTLESYSADKADQVPFKKGDVVVAKDGFLDKGETLQDTLGLVVNYTPENDYLVLGVLNPEDYALAPTFSMRGGFYRKATRDELRQWGIIK